MRRRADLDEVGGERIGLMLSFEGVEPLADDPAAFARWWDAGVRMVGFNHRVLGNPVPDRHGVPRSTGGADGGQQ